MSVYRALTDGEVDVLTEQGCSTLDWDKVVVTDGFNAARVRNSHFIGGVKIGSLSGNVKSCSGLDKTSGIYNAIIADCTIGNDCRIANVGVHIDHYNIGNQVSVENVGTISCSTGATFGNGVEIEVLNEGGGREVILFDELSAQFAYLTCLHRYRPDVVKNLNAIAQKYTDSVRSDFGTIADGACVCSVKEIRNVNIGEHAKISGADSLKNGTILSAQDAVTTVGTAVIADDFIIGESSSVTDGAILSKSFVGQGCKVGKQFSAENCLFFANCEAFHGEGCSAFGGPYTVTHHKSTLLIAGLFSFYNAGSGTNKSNHMYKLGPVHEGKLSRGCKTGSFSYMMWPCRVGPFSVVLGKHTGTFDTADYPFSHLEATPSGRANMVPGLHLTTVGTVRDGAKWPSRDRRKGKIKRDLINFEVFSPYIVGKMIKANDALKKLQDETDKSVEEVSVGGALVRRPILRTGQKFYRNGIEMYLMEKTFEKMESALAGGLTKIQTALANDGGALYSEEWVDICGQLMPQARLEQLHDAIGSGKVKDLDGFIAAVNKIFQNYAADEWVWVKQAFKKVFSIDLDAVTKDDVAQVADGYLKTKGKFLKLVLNDANKEFDELSHSGFGQDGNTDDNAKDFEEIRGCYADNKFVKDMQSDLAELESRVKAFLDKVFSM